MYKFNLCEDFLCRYVWKMVFPKNHVRGEEAKLFQVLNFWNMFVKIIELDVMGYSILIEMDGVGYFSSFFIWMDILFIKDYINIFEKLTLFATFLNINISNRHWNQQTWMIFDKEFQKIKK